MTVYTPIIDVNFIPWIINSILAVIIVILPVAAAILLQIYLCKKESKRLGLILPVLSGCYSIAAILSMITYTEFQISTCVLYFLLINVPTLVFILIYRSCRKKYRIRKEMDTMNIQDLE